VLFLNAFQKFLNHPRERSFKNLTNSIFLQRVFASST
jgi:hypothetical protein